MLEYNEFAYKKTTNHCKLEDRFKKKSQILKFIDEKTAYSEGRLYYLSFNIDIYIRKGFTSE